MVECGSSTTNVLLVRCVSDGTILLVTVCRIAGRGSRSRVVLMVISWREHPGPLRCSAVDVKNVEPW
eukprot:111031-Chlamydomonas_euryale.AAC.2